MEFEISRRVLVFPTYTAKAIRETYTDRIVLINVKPCGRSHDLLLIKIATDVHHDIRG